MVRSGHYSLVQYFLTRGDFAPQRGFGKVLRHLWLLQLELLLLSSGQRPGMSLTILPCLGDSTHDKERLAPNVNSAAGETLLCSAFLASSCSNGFPFPPCPHVHKTPVYTQFTNTEFSNTRTYNCLTPSEWPTASNSTPPRLAAYKRLVRFWLLIAGY